VSTFVLVHGSCHGGWSWKKLSPILRKSQHEVYALTLTELGERSHLVSRDVSLNTCFVAQNHYHIGMSLLTD